MYVYSNTDPIFLQLILAEGVNSLTVPELHTACSARGIVVIGASTARLRSELSQWLDLHLHHHIPTTLLVLSRAFMISDRVLPEEALQLALTSLPDKLINETALTAKEAKGEATYKEKLDVIEEQEELIEDEREQEMAS